MNNIKKLLTVDGLISLLSIIYVGGLYHFSIMMWETRQRYGILFVGFTLMLSMLFCFKQSNLFPGLKGKITDVLLWLLLILTFVTMLYFFLNYENLTYYRAGAHNGTDFTFSVIILVLMFYITFMSTGPVIPLVCFAFILYGLLGHLIPTSSIFYHSPMSMTRILEVCAAEVDGIFGMLNEIGATWVAIFAFFASFVQGFGGLDYVLRLSYQIVGKSKANLPQVAVLSSMAFGGMSGSAIANVVGTGAFTIPTMKRFGIPAKTAAAIECVSSSGGQVMPPILGAVAFVMADYLNLYYYQILLASIYPSIIFFGSVMISVYFLSRKHIKPDCKVDMPEEFKTRMTRREMQQGLPILIAFATLLFVFIAFRVNILLGGFFTTIAFLICQLIYEVYYKGFKSGVIKEYLWKLYDGAMIGAKTMLSIGLMLSLLGIVIGILTTTGLAEKMSYYMVTVFGSSMALFLFFTCVICIIFGMAVTTVAAYILAVTLAAPALLKLGVPPLVTHFAVFYWSMLSAITPPVASVCVAGAGVANSKFFPTCWEAMKLGFPIFALPVIFVVQPNILVFGWKGLGPFLLCAVGFASFAGALQSDLNVLQRLVLLICSLAIFFLPLGLCTWIAWGVTLILIFTFMTLRAKKRKAFEANLEALESI